MREFHKLDTNMVTSQQWLIVFNAQTTLHLAAATSCLSYASPYGGICWTSESFKIELHAYGRGLA